MLNDALSFAKRGLAIFLLEPGKKTPHGFHCPNGVKNATKDFTIIQRWWSKCPTGNMGIALGQASGLCAIDLDRKNVGVTERELRDFLQRHNIHRTVITKTKFGFHIYGKYDARLKNNLKIQEATDTQPSATLRSDGYYTIAPGSIVTHDDGDWEYQFYSDTGGMCSFDESTLADFTGFALQGNSSQSIPDRSQAEPDGSEQRGRENGVERKYGAGDRHDMFRRTAVAMRIRGCEAEEIRRELTLRNTKDCNPPKPQDEAIKDIDGIVDWVMKNTQPKNWIAGDIQENKKENYLIPLGWRDNHYFYTSDNNQTITSLTASEHNAVNLLRLHPLPFWFKHFGKETKQGERIDWTQAASELMEGCRDNGFFDEGKVRGSGCWNAQGKLLIHLGDKIKYDDKMLSLNEIADGYIYPLGISRTISEAHLSQDECLLLIKACESLNWTNSSSAKLLAGGLAIFRLCGALKWRPMLWLTGPSGTGKTTVVDRLIKPIAGDWASLFNGSTTEAGMRQELKSDSRPVIFDEAETSNEKTAKRIQAIVELIRQSSSGGGKIVKGTPSGKSLRFNANSSFILSSVRVNLTEEADVNRFCQLLLNRRSQDNWDSVQRALDPIDKEYGDKLFATMVARWDELQSAIAIFEDEIAKFETRRTAQQYSALLGGYWLLQSATLPTSQQAAALASDIIMHNVANDERDESEEHEALNWYLSHTIRANDKDIRLDVAIKEASCPGVMGNELLAIGVVVKPDCVYIQLRNPHSQKVFSNTRWPGTVWYKTIARLPGALLTIHTFGNTKLRCLRLPLSVVE